MGHLTISFAVIAVLLCFPTSAYSGWLIYHKPPFRGKVIDAETKEPIQGAVVVVVYNKHTLISGPAGGHTSVVEVKEVLTDKDGEFFFPSYTTIIQPNSIEHYPQFIIYKPGYGSLRDRVSPPGGISLATKESFFLEENFGKQGEVLIVAGRGRNSLKKVTFGLVELPRLKTREERLKAIPGNPGFTTPEDMPVFFRLINEEYKRFGLKPVGRPLK